MHSKVIAAAAAVATALTLGMAVAAAEPANITTVPSGQPVLSLANPSAGDVVPYGDYIISGMAFDPAATDGSGITSVDLFLGRREDGGLFLGEAVPGKTMFPGTNNSLAQNGFQIKVTVPTHQTGGRDLYAYTLATSGVESVMSVPIYVGAAPTPTPRPNTSFGDSGGTDTNQATANN